MKWTHTDSVLYVCPVSTTAVLGKDHDKHVIYWTNALWRRIDSNVHLCSRGHPSYQFQYTVSQTRPIPRTRLWTLQKNKRDKRKITRSSHSQFTGISLSNIIMIKIKINIAQSLHSSDHAQMKILVLWVLSSFFYREEEQLKQPTVLLMYIRACTYPLKMFIVGSFSCSH